MKMNLKIFITCLFTFFCFYMCTTYPPVSEPPKIWYSASYDYDLMKVEKSGDIIEIDSTYSSICIFEDSLINIKWSIKHNKLLFNLVNKTQNTLSINWDNIIFVDINGKSYRVIHSGIKFNEKEKPQVPTNIIRKGSIDDLIIPAEKISYFKGFTSSFLDISIPSSWNAGPLISPCCTQNKQETEILAIENIGKIFQVLLPIHINNISYEYIFSFCTKDYEINTDCPSNRVDE